MGPQSQGSGTAIPRCPVKTKTLLADGEEAVALVAPENVPKKIELSLTIVTPEATDTTDTKRSRPDGAKCDDRVPALEVRVLGPKCKYRKRLGRNP
jgi:hypothetical protein